MIVAPLLVMFALLVALIAPRVLRDAAWTRRAPRLAVVAWQTVSLSVPVSVMLAGVALAVPVLPATATDDVAGLLGACELMLREHYETPGGFAVGVLGAAGAAAVLTQLVQSVLHEFRVAGRERLRQRDGLALISRTDVVPGAWVIEDERPAVFCIPGVRSSVVLTSAAVRVLTPRQRELALAHEHAHIAGRHHVALTFASGLRRAMPGVRLFAVAEAEIATLVEMHADDRAARAADRPELAAALVRLAQGPRPSAALAANGGVAVQRVQRLLSAVPDLPRGQRWSIRLVAAAVVCMPVLIAVAPALETALLDYCGVALHV